MGTWPVELVGVTETLVTTPGPNDRWNVAALGVHAPEEGGAPTARTWGRTRTWRNFRERGQGYVQFTTDPVRFAEAALTVTEIDSPVLDDAKGWVQVRPERLDSGSDGGTEWVDWRLPAERSAVESRVVPTFSRAYGAVVEATVAASRLGVEGYDSERLRERIAYFEDVVERCGGPRHERAFDVVRDAVE
ncbi:DUF447 family protein [Halovenus sp. WSH3]|uniref:DUF447 family protein n=1 Tax=Halovenus carboxidivorans TaxID=2692199 RepID=A0A6B0T678_9EURY|nr:DUF447 domain-containing protein [Halovenus carboxidivorans]MXR51083.1 DUF447 family protein [Halovenus carboxidivorans]